MLTVPVVLLAAAVVAEPPAPWWHDAVFYEVFVRSFADSAEGPLAADGIGDFAGLTARLDYLNDGDPATTSDLGINAVWLMPINESPSYHGYDIVDYRSVDAEYGTPEDFRAFTDAAHDRGVRVIIDLVLNHCSSQHPWFVEAATSPDSPKRDWFIWSDSDPGFRGPWGQQVWHRSSRQGGPYYYGCFTRGMPDLNLTNPQVTAELKEVARFWIEDMGVDGFRLDAIKHLIEDGATQENTQATIDWLEDFQAHCRSLNPEFFSVGEVWSTTDQVARYIPDAVDTAFEFDLAQNIIDTLNSGDTGPLKARLRAVLDAYDTPVATFLTNHDQPRVMTQLRNDPAKARAAAAILLTLPGVPFIYYGEEIGTTGDKPDPNIRTPMQWDTTGEAFSTAEPWRAAQPDARDRNVRDQQRHADSLHAWYTRLINLRHQHESLRSGELIPLEASDPAILAYLRRDDAGHQLLVLVNTGEKPIGWAAVPLDRPVGSNRARDISGNRRPIGSLNEDNSVFRSGGLRVHEVFVIELDPPASQ